MSILKTIYLQHLNGANANMTLDSNGYVGVGTTSPNRPLEVAGAWRLGTDSGAYAGGLGGGFNVSNNIYSMYFRDRTDTSWNDVFFETKSLRLKVNNGADTGIYIDSSGRVTMPYQPAFQVYDGSGTISGDAADITLPSVRYNIGSHYNTSTGRFTAPIAGRYLFTAQVRFDAWTSGGYGRLLFAYNNSSTYTHGHVITGANHSNDYESLSISAILNLAVNDYVQLRGGRAGGSTTIQWESQFSGCLLA